MAGELDPPAAALGRALDHVDTRAIVSLHVAIARGETRRLSIVQVTGDGERLEEHLGHDHRASQIQHDAAAFQGRQRFREPLEVAVAGGAQRRSIGRGMLMDDVGAHGRVYRDRHAQRRARDQH